MASQLVREIMTANPMTIDCARPLTEAARAMRDRDVGPVIVTDKGKIAGILTDRDIVVRAVADGRAPDQITVGDVCTADCLTVNADDPIDQTIDLMRKQAIRRVPVVDGDRPVGIVSLGDLAIERDPKSALADISNAPPNN